MFIKSTVLAFAAVAALGTTALTSTSAYAAGFRGMAAKAAASARRLPWAHGHVVIALRTAASTPPRGHFGHHPVTVTCTGRPLLASPQITTCRARSSTLLRPVVYGAAPIVNRCTCLTKEYTPEGAVLFKDICTNEAAINPPPAPVQTGYAPMPTVRSPSKA